MTARILIIRSASQYALLQSIEAAREDHGATEFGILCQPAHAATGGSLGRVHLWPDDSRFSRDRAPSSLAAEIASASYDIGVALYSAEGGVGSENVDALLAALPVPKRLGYDSILDEWIEIADAELAARRDALERRRWDRGERTVRAIERIRRMTRG